MSSLAEPETTRVQRLGIEVRGISKRYRGARALEDVTLTIAPGEIHALVGENGAGKSTLGKIIAGAVAADEGEIVLNGEPIRHRSPRDAIQMGIALIDQELATVPGMSVLDNVFLGSERVRGMVLDTDAQRTRLRELAERIGFTADARVPAGTLRVADQQKIEVLRALVREARLIIMDEPTAALSRVEAQRLLTIARELRDDGVTVVFVSHTLEDVLALSDTISVLKDGRHVKSSPAAQESVESLVTAMLGRSVDLVFPGQSQLAQGAPVRLSVRGLTRAPAFADVDFDIHRGEIVGLAGLVGSGRSEIARGIFGADAADGDVSLDGEALGARSPQRGIAAGIAMLPESRKEQGLAMHRSVSENVTMVHLGAVCRRGVLQRRRERALVDEMLKKVDARASSPAISVSALSGGNQQKVALAKWLVRPPKVLIADEPTRGVDVGAKLAIYRLISGLAAEGVAVLLISSELEEVMGLAHRVLVVRNGRIVAEHAGEDANEEAIMRSAFGGAPPPVSTGSATGRGTERSGGASSER